MKMPACWWRWIGRASVMAILCPGLDPVDAHGAELDVIRVGSCSLSGVAVAVEVSGSTTYVAGSEAGLHVIETTDPTHPRRVGGYLTTGPASALAVAGRYVYLVDPNAMTVIDVSVPSQPRRMGSYSASGQGSGIAVAGDRAYVTCQASGLHVVDISNPAAPRRLSVLKLGDYTSGVTVTGGLAWVSDAVTGLHVIDISNANLLRRVGRFATGSSVKSVGISGNYAFVADALLGLQVVDFTNPAELRRVGGYLSSSFIQNVVVIGSQAFTANHATGMQVLDISDPTDPRHVGSSAERFACLWITVSGEYAYAAVGNEGLAVLRVVPRLVLTTQPQARAVFPGEDVTLSVRVAGADTPSYQWRKGGAVLPGATRADFTVTNVQPADAGEYAVVVTGPYGSAMTTSAALTVLPPIRFTTEPVAVLTVAGGGPSGETDGPAAVARFNSPNAGSTDPKGDSYFADTGNHRIRRLTSLGVVTSVAGSGVGGFADGSALESQFLSPLGACADDHGNVYVADTGNHRIRKITADGTVSTLAGTGVAGWSDGPAASAQFDVPNDLVIDPAGNLYVTDFNNHAVRRVAPDGSVTTWVGDGTAGDRDGPRTQARLNRPGGLAIDPAGRLYITEWSGQRIRRVSVDGDVQTLAGDGIAGYRDGAATRARFQNPDGIVVGVDGAVLVTDRANHVIRRVTPGGQVETVAGIGVAGWTDGAGATSRFSSPAGLGLRPNGRVVVADSGNHAIREIRFPESEAIPQDVSVADETSLRKAIRRWDRVRLSFADPLRLTQPLVIDKDTVLEGIGPAVTLSGNGAVRVFEVRPNVQFVLKNLVIADGHSDAGGGLWNDGGNVTAVGCIFTNNHATGQAGTNGFTPSPEMDPGSGRTLSGGSGGSGRGGAILNFGFLVASNCLFAGNVASGGPGGTGGSVGARSAFPGSMFYYGGTQGPGGTGGPAEGGAIHHEGALLRCVDCSFLANSALGGRGGNAPSSHAATYADGGLGGEAQGGAISAERGALELVRCRLDDNLGIAGAGGDVERVSVLRSSTPLAPLGRGGSGGNAWGGGLFARAGGDLNDCELTGNRTIGGAGGKGGWPAPDWVWYSTTGPHPGPGGPGGTGGGGGLWSGGTIRVNACSWVSNHALGGAGGAGADGTGLGNDITGTFGYESPGAPGGNGGHGIGGALLNHGTNETINATFSDNVARGGRGGPGGNGGVTYVGNGLPTGTRGGDGGPGGTGSGGGVANVDGLLRVLHATLAHNTAEPGTGGDGGRGSFLAGVGWSGPAGSPGASHQGGGIFNGGGAVTLANSIIAGSTAGGNLAGTILDAGHNLSSDSSLALAGPGSMTNTDPQLGGLGNFGGRTPTIPLLAGSPALDAADPAACPTADQRGLPRPLGNGCDIGAVEGAGLLPQQVLLTAVNPSARVGDAIQLILDIRNSNPTTTLANLTGEILLPPGLTLLSGTLQLADLSILPGESYQSRWSVRVDQPGEHAIAAGFQSSITGAARTMTALRIVGSGPPEILTAWARWQTDGNATLESVIVPNGAPGTARFEYGPTPSLGLISPPLPLEPGFDPVPIRFATGIPSTSGGLHYRIAVSNDLGLSGTPTQWVPPPQTLESCDTPSLRAALAAGGYVRLACDGTVDVSAPLVISRNTVLDATDHDVVLSGGDTARVLEVLPDVDLTLINIEVTRGRHRERGGALLNSNGVVRVLGGAFDRNSASGSPGSLGNPGGDARGGAIHNTGVLYLDGVRLRQNQAAGGNGWSTYPEDRTMYPTAGGFAGGGAIWHAGGTAVLRSCLVLSNHAIGGHGASAWYKPYSDGRVPVGGDGRPAWGGAVAQDGGRLWVTESAFQANAAAGGNAGMGTGGGGWSTRSNGMAGHAWGGAIHSQGDFRAQRVLLASNTVVGGRGAPSVTVTNNGVFGADTIAPLPAQPGGDAQGAALSLLFPGTIANTTIVGNHAIPGPGGAADIPGALLGVAGTSAGGGLALVDASVLLVNSTWSDNHAQTGADLAATNGIFRVANTILAGDPTTPRVSGRFVDLGGNLTTDRTAAFGTPSSLSGTNPRLLPLADNGGSTWTLALAPDSPAIDAGNDAFSPSFDQRGEPRPAGAASDIGAFEVQPSPLAQSATAKLRPDGSVWLRFVAWPNRLVVLESTTDWREWRSVSTNVTDTQGILEAVDPNALESRWRFYRVRTDAIPNR